ncbi:hypothetical protein L9F63_015071, partial [Diploptera punctata]
FKFGSKEINIQPQFVSNNIDKPFFPCENGSPTLFLYHFLTLFIHEKCSFLEFQSVLHIHSHSTNGNISSALLQLIYTLIVGLGCKTWSHGDYRTMTLFTTNYFSFTSMVIAGVKGPKNYARRSNFQASLELQFPDIILRIL